MILVCHDMQVHQACYGVSKVPKGRWYCRPCRTSSKDIVRDLNIHKYNLLSNSTCQPLHQLLIFCALSNMSLSRSRSWFIDTYTSIVCYLRFFTVMIQAAIDSSTLALYGRHCHIVATHNCTSRVSLSLYLG